MIALSWPGTNPTITSTRRGSTTQPTPQPTRKSGTAVRKKPKMYFRSRPLNPGTRKAKIWNSHSGLEMTMPIISAICSRMSHALVMPE